MVAYIQKSNLAARDQIRSVCATTTEVALGGLAGVLSSVGQAIAMNAANGMALPGSIKSTVKGTIMRIPIRKKDSNMVFYIFADGVCASSSSFLALAIRKPYHGSTIQDYSPAFGAGITIATSTDELGWKMFYTTKCVISSTIEAEGFLAGPFESNKYALNFGPTSTGGGSTAGHSGNYSAHYIDAGQNYMEIMVGPATGGITGVTKATTGTFLDLTSAWESSNGSICVLPIEIP